MPRRILGDLVPKVLMKTRLALLITAALLAVGLPIPAHADTPFTFTVNGGDATITGYNGTAPAELDIPDVITDDNGTYTVTAIGENAFESNELTELDLPDTLTTISDYAFATNQLTELDLPNALTTISEAAFYDNQLAKLDLPDTLTTIGDYAFSTNQLTELTLPNALTTIANFAFHNNQLTELDLPNALTTIGNYALSTNQLTELDLPNALTTIGSFAFHNNQLTELDLPDTLTTIGNYAFYNNQLTDLDLPDALTTIGNYAFHANQLTDLDLPDALTTIGEAAFGENPLTSVVVGSAVSSIGNFAFGTQVTAVRFTGEAPEMGADVFYDSDPTVRFPWKFGDPRAADGYTTPAWKGYDTIAVADVTFAAGDDTTTQAVDVGAAAAEPVGPGRAGQIFFGWFADAATTPFDFSTAISGDMTLTAGYRAGTAPVLTGAATATVKLGDAFAWTPTTLTGDPAPTVTATDLPDGLEINNETGVISGSVTDQALTGDHAVTITATNDIDPDATLDLTISIEGFTYSVADDATTITGYHGATPADLVIPDAISRDGESYPVTAIGDSAFANNQLTELTLPNTLTTIGAEAFAENRLTELDLPRTLATISEGAFAYNQLTELAVPASVTSIGYEAFAHNPELDNVRFVGAAPGLGDDALGTSDPTVRFRWKLGHPRVTAGYTTPTWNGYDTIAVADVSFAGGGDIEPQTVDIDGASTVAKPTDPTKAGQVFAGWFADAATAPFDFTKPITGDIVLTAGFAVPAVPAPGVPASPADPAITGLAPSITGNPHEGKTLTAKPGPVGPAGATVTYQWLADGQSIKGSTKPSLKLGKAHAGKRITVTITATRATATPVTKTSAKTKIVSSAKPRIVVSTRKVGKNQPVTVTATGFKARQKITIWLGKEKRYTGRADSRGVLSKAVKFAKGTKAGTHRVRVTSQAKGSRNQTVQTTVRYR